MEKVFLLSEKFVSEGITRKSAAHVLEPCARIVQQKYVIFEGFDAASVLPYAFSLCLFCGFLSQL
jgi:hypothetical protein